MERRSPRAPCVEAYAEISRRLSLLTVGAVESLAALGHPDELFARLKLRTVFSRELFGARDEGLKSHAVDERHGAARIGRVTKAKDRADVGLARIGDDAL